MLEAGLPNISYQARSAASICEDCHLRVEAPLHRAHRVAAFPGPGAHVDAPHREHAPRQRSLTARFLRPSGS